MSKKTNKHRFPVVLAVVVLGLSLGIGALTAERQVEQPFAFNHLAHTAKADCSLCHRGVRTRQHAGISALEVCRRCHATAPGKQSTTAQAQLWKKAAQGEAPAWNRLNRLPLYVYFSHRRHVTIAAIECYVCHGDMEHRKSPPTRPLVRIKMRQCIECHESERVTVDCTSCHR